MIIITFMSQSVLGIIDFVFIPAQSFQIENLINQYLGKRMCTQKLTIIKSIIIYVDLRSKLSQTIIVII